MPNTLGETFLTVDGFIRRLYLDELQTLSCLLFPLVSFGNTEVQADNNKKQPYSTILKLISRLFEDYSRNLNSKESHPGNIFTRNTLTTFL